VEREVGREVIVAQKAERVAYGVSYVDIHPVLQYPVDAVVEGRGNRAYDYKAD
jgi:hypothetical protein